MVSELAAGEPLSASSLSALVGISAATASEHLARLVEGRVLRVERIGRHAYYQLASNEVAVALASLASVAPDLVPAEPPEQAPSQLSEARTCYDHLGGRLGVVFTETLQERGLIRRRGQRWEVDAERWDEHRPLGIACASLQRSRRPIARGCMDWSQARHHIAGSLAAAVTRQFFQLGWLSRTSEHDRAVMLTGAGLDGLNSTFGLSLATDWGPLGT